MQVSISTVITIIDTARQEVCFVIAKLARGGPESSAPGWQVSCFTKGKNTRRTHANFPPPRPGPDSPGSRLAALGKTDRRVIGMFGRRWAEATRVCVRLRG